MAVLFQSEATVQGEAITMQVNYDPITLRLTTVSWNNPVSGLFSARLRMWDENGEEVHMRAEGSQSGQRSIVGVYHAVEIPEDPGQYDLPAGWEWAIDAV